MTTVLDGILASTRADVDRRRADRPLTAQPTSRPAHAFRDALGGPGLSIIAEHKRRSPSAGRIGHGLGVGEIAVAYERGGAAAISVLTEERNFDGSLDDLRAARAATRIPIIRKDFVVDPYQLVEAVDAGADAVLLIVAALGRRRLGELHSEAVGLGLGVLVEVHDADELEIALDVGPSMIGINNRDLRDFSVDVGRTLALAPLVPDGTIVVSESGIDSPAGLETLRDAGIDAALVGEALMRSVDPGTALRQLLRAAG
ncbi:MAG TPA: indole-3-glycerol phosphate synthase TrpC [Solirubrobacteraceae bacterium]|nr:indole-3-glycerol phosphate synthase TrpC [Solirubrobacteraceae bacterium]